MRAFARTAFLGCLAAAMIMGQQPTFDAVSVKVVKLAFHPAFGNTGGPGTSDPGRIHLCCVGMFSLLMTAYDVELDRIFGPSWIMENMGPNLYQVDATMPADTTKARYQLMMQQMLRERFRLEIHREKRNFAGYELAIAEGGPKLKESRPDPNAAPDASLEKRDAAGMLLLQPATDAYVPRVAPPTPLPADSPGGEPSIFVALRKQLGLKLNKVEDVPLDVIVVDRVEKTPTAN